MLSEPQAQARPSPRPLNPRFAPATRMLWGLGVVGALEAVARAGFCAAEVWTQHLWVRNERPEAVGSRARALGLRLSLHAPSYDLNPLSSNPEVRAVSRRQVLESLDTADAMGARVVVAHPGGLSSSTDDPEDYWPRLLDYAAALDRRAADLGLTVALEGMERKKLQFVTDLGALSRLAHSLESAGLARVGLALDVAHAFTLGDPLEYVLAAPRLAHAHLSDSSERKTHALFGDGEIDLARVVPALLSRLEGTDGLIALEGRHAPDEPLALERAQTVLAGF